MVQAACECLPHTVQSMLADLAYDFLKDKTQTQFMTLLHILSMCMRRFNAVSFVCVWFGAGVAVCGRVILTCVESWLECTMRFSVLAKGNREPGVC